MFLQLAHTKPDVFQYSRALTLECYRRTKTFPAEERYALTSQIRRAVLTVHLNIAEGCSPKSLPERKRFFEVSRGSVIEVDTAVDIAMALEYCSEAALAEHLIRVFKMLSSLIGHEAPTHHSPFNLPA